MLTSLARDADALGSIKVEVEDIRPVAYASRTLTPVERRYSQSEREALAVLFGIQRFH
ncbi:MAG: RNase H-like domain-containing protein, partial [Candidatus Thiodiazotropha sp.]